MFDTIAAADLAWIQGFPSGRFVSACISDVGAVNAAGTGIITGIFRNGLTFVFVFSAMLYLDWRMSLVVLLGAPVAVLNLNRQKKRIKRASGMTYQEFGQSQQPADADAFEHAGRKGLWSGDGGDDASSSGGPEVFASTP